MRLRRETGFSIVIDGTADTANCQIRQGLNAEDLIGVVIQFGTIVSVVTSVMLDSGDYYLTVAGVSLDDTVKYNPVTGVVTYIKQV